MSVRPYSQRRRRAFNPATKRLLEYGLIGVVIGAALVAGLQLRPQSVFPSYGTLQIDVTSGVPGAQLGIQDRLSCHGSCNATSINVTITQIEVHTSGINNMTGMWTSVCQKELPKTFNLSQIATVTRSLCGASIQPDTITNVRISVSSVVANVPSVGIMTLTVPSGKLEIPLSPSADVQAGKTTTLFIVLQPHVVCQGMGNCKLTPVLDAISKGPE